MKAALIGDRIGPSLTPALHEAEGHALGLCYEYSLIDTAEQPMKLQDTLELAERKGCQGVNVTHPHKQAVLSLLDDCSEAAKAIGAVNTVVFSNGKRLGENTDSSGFIRSLRQVVGQLAGKNIIIFGAGGAGSAVAYALAEAGIARITLMDSDVAKAEMLADRLRIPGVAISITDEPDLSQFDGAVNCTPVGMIGYPGCPFDPSKLPPHAWVADCVYFPKETELVQKSRTAGLKTIDGTGMALFQAAEAFGLITGCEPDIARMERSLGRLLDERGNGSP